MLNTKFLHSYHVTFKFIDEVVVNIVTIFSLVKQLSHSNMSQILDIDVIHGTMAIIPSC